MVCQLPFYSATICSSTSWDLICGWCKCMCTIRHNGKHSPLMKIKRWKHFVFTFIWGLRLRKWFIIYFFICIYYIALARLMIGFAIKYSPQMLCKLVCCMALFSHKDVVISLFNMTCFYYVKSIFHLFNTCSNRVLSLKSNGGLCTNSGSTK